MPSTTRAFINAKEYSVLPCVGLTLLAFIFIAAVIATCCGYGLKIYVIASGSSAAFEACGLTSVLEALFVSVIILSFMFGCGILGGLMLLANALFDKPDSYNYNDPLTVGDILLYMLLAGVVAYLFVAFGVSAVTWANTSQIEEILLFYPEFYVDDFSKCATGQDRVHVELAVLIFKIDSFISMLQILLACPCTVLGILLNVILSEEGV